MYIHIIFFLFNVKKIPDDEKFAFFDNVSYFSKLFYCLKTNSKYLKSDGSVENWRNTIREIIENLNNPVGRYFAEPGQSIRTRLSRTGTIQLDENFENRDKPVGRDYREAEQSNPAIFWRTGTIDSNEIFENQDNPV